MRSFHRQSKAFTLMEVIVAVVIFSLVVSSLVVSFRTGVKAYDIGITHSELDQTIRFVTSKIAEDLRNVYYKQPWTYNITRNQREQLLAEREQQLLQAGSRTSLLDDPTLPELGPRIDLSFRATDNGEADDLSFARLEFDVPLEMRHPWGLARVRYLVVNNTLYRAVDDVIAPETDENGNEIPKPTQPTIDKLANNVKAFDLKFGYYYDGEWLLANDWDSDASQYRNPTDEEEEEMSSVGGIRTTYSGGMQTSGPLQQRKSDDLPAWVEITYTFTDPKKTEKEKTVTQVVQLYPSQETYIPPEAEEGSQSERNIFRTRRSER
ncbi:MAG: prepilin-type N-terminal cleavage/methylation domain-containing protein [Candidatus Hydrogenedentota bacterium]|uniref:Type II secretion system protein GspJ n=1 Tax=Sumerlaea chitinivorans TaxID=2250252 RepID=A0A2Z4Y628_SUMC1|nr:type II secretion system protein GspJ [Candidatus Sumerlaea chitinivorans]RMH26966.1 MAG: prepilin-type N-terminal cleavage/methylation domain-containing protein [Candidatus Hydrogenedentota bacterium]GIX45742.1 MAG: hypothetical protein KatS3mg130_2150 [Candidatus Sumerlaea sp.]